MKLSIFSRSALVAALLAAGLAACDKKDAQTTDTADAGSATVSVSEGWTLKPGKWEISGETMVQGMTTTIPATSICVTEAMSMENQASATDNQTSGCKVENKGIASDKLRISVSCDAPVKSTTDIAIGKVSDEEFTMMSDSVVNMNGTEMKSSTEMKYKYVGQCDA